MSKDYEVIPADQWKLPVYFVREQGHELPYRGKIGHLVVCLAFESDVDGTEWLTVTSNADFELQPIKTNDGCIAFLQLLKSVGITHIWRNPLRVGQATLYVLDDVLRFLDTLRQAARALSPPDSRSDQKS